MHYLASPRLAVLVLAAGLAAIGCSKDNPNFCQEPDCTPTDGPVDVAIDTAMGCNAQPSICTPPNTTCVMDVCSDCNYSVDTDEQSTDCGDPAAPVCGTGNSCRPCMDHEECASGVCFNGACQTTGVLYVNDENSTDGGGNDCTSAGNPCRTVVRAVGEVPTGGNPDTNRRFIRIMSHGTYSGAVVIDDKAVWIVAPPPDLSNNSRATITRGSNGLILSIIGNADVRLDRVAVNNGTDNTNGDAISCTNDSTLIALGIETFNNTGIGVIGDTCDLTLIGSVVVQNDEGGISVTGGRAVLVNNIVAENGGSGSVFGGISLAPSVSNTSVVQSNTVVRNIASGTNPDGINCQITGVTARNNVIYGSNAAAPRVAGPCAHNNTLYGPSEPLPLILLGQPGNMQVSDDAMFLFVNASMRNYRLQGGSVAKDKGTITGLATEAMRDIDGELRPQGTADVGCDEIP